MQGERGGPLPLSHQEGAGQTGPARGQGARSPGTRVRSRLQRGRWKRGWHRLTVDIDPILARGQPKPPTDHGAVRPSVGLVVRPPRQRVRGPHGRGARPPRPRSPRPRATAPARTLNRPSASTKAAAAPGPTRGRAPTASAGTGTPGTRNRAGGLNPPRHIGQAPAVTTTATIIAIAA